MIGEAEYQHNGGKTDKGLATTLKLGGWGTLGKFNDQRFAIDGRLLADPTGPGEPLKHRGNIGIYAVIDQQLYRPAGGDSRKRHLGVQPHVGQPVRPQSDRLLYRRRHRVRGLDPAAARTTSSARA